MSQHELLRHRHEQHKPKNMHSKKDDKSIITIKSLIYGILRIPKKLIY